MTATLSARRRIERALVPGLLQTVVLMLAETVDDRDALNEVIEALDYAIQDPFTDIHDQDERAKLARRCRRASRDALAEFVATKATVGKTWLAVSLWIADLAERGVIEIGKDSSLARAYEALAEAMAKHESLLNEMERSATKGAARIHRSLQMQGYFTEAA